MIQPTTTSPAASPPRWPDPIVVAAARLLHAEGFRHQVIRYGALRHLWTHPAGIEITGYANGDDTGTMSVTLEGDLQARLLHVTAGQAVGHLALLELLPRIILDVCWGTDEEVPFDAGDGPEDGYLAGWCGHRVAVSEWRAGFRVCERCPDPRVDLAGQP